MKQPLTVNPSHKDSVDSIQSLDKSQTLSFHEHEEEIKVIKKKSKKNTKDLEKALDTLKEREEQL